jgi:uncharacterized protein YjeT (DUF2065 family)
MRDFLVGLSLVFVIEGIVLAALPGRLKQVLEMVHDMGDEKLRQIGIVAALAGVVGVWLLR